MCNLYFQCDKGAAGDMMGAALMGLVENKEEMLSKLNHMGIPHVEYILEEKEKYGINGNAMTVKIHGEIEEQIHEKTEHRHHHHSHMTMEAIQHIVDEMQVSDKVKKDIMDIYNIIAEAESKAHSCPVSEVHFHEVGAMDAIADVAAVCQILEELAPSEILASEIHVGNGTVQCAHGILPVPAPATANILSDIPYEHGDIEGEICTPTAAALIKHFVDQFSDRLPENDQNYGIGIGKRTFQTPSYFKVCMF